NLLLWGKRVGKIHITEFLFIYVIWSSAKTAGILPAENRREHGREVNDLGGRNRPLYSGAAGPCAKWRCRLLFGKWHDDVRRLVQGTVAGNDEKTIRSHLLFFRNGIK